MSTLQELLNYGLVDIGSEDSRFEKMQSASSALTVRFKNEPDLLIPATLIALDEGVEENDPMFSLVEELVIAKWKTLRNTHVNRPRELLRSIIIDSLTTFISGNPEAAGIVWNTAASPLQHQQVRLGKADPVIQKILKEAMQTAEDEAVVRSRLVAPTQKKHSGKKAKPDSLSLSIKGKIKDEDILAEVARSAGPTYSDLSLEDPNPSWPNPNQNWSNEFTPRMSTALVKAVNLGIGRLAESISSNLAVYLEAFKKQLVGELSEFEHVQNEISQTHQSGRMRLDVLWWSESLYSPSLQIGYRELPLPVAAVAAAVDLTTIVPALAPASVGYVLGETVRRLTRILDAKGNQPIISYLKDLTSAKPDFGVRFHKAPNGDMRSPLLALVVEASKGSEISSEILLSGAGIDAKHKLSSADFGMWVYRDLQSRRLAEVLR